MRRDCGICRWLAQATKWATATQCGLAVLLSMFNTTWIGIITIGV